jgi:hypothetical protein
VAENRDEVRAFAGALYPLGVLLSVVPLIDVATRAWPFRYGAPEWRFAAFGTLFGSLGTMLIGLAVLGFVAAYRGNAVLLRVVSVVAILGGVIALVLLALFALDALQVRQMAPEAMRRSITSSAISAATAALLGAASLFGVGVGAWISSRAGWRTARRAGRPAAPNPMVVQSSITGGKSK